MYDDYSSSFETLLERDTSFTIHQQNIQSMLIEIYKSLNKASAENFFDSLFELKFRQSQFPLELKMPFCNSVYHDKNSIRYFGPQIWNSVPFEIRNAVTLEDFSRKIKFWKPEECPCRLCMHYEREVGSDYIYQIK